MQIREFLMLPHRFMWGGDGRSHPHDIQRRIYNDCTTFCASWAEVLCGIDPARGLRGQYRTSEGAHSIVDAGGGQIAFMAARLEPIGFVRVEDLLDGDIGCVSAPIGMEGGFSEVGAVRFGPLWASLGPGGVVAKPLRTVAAWRYGR